MMPVNFRVHRTRFYTPTPEAIRAVSYDNKSRIAVVRSNGSVELWNNSATPFLEGVIHNPPGSSVEAVAWFQNRLFSVGLDGYITEYDVIQLATRRSITVVYGPSWAMEVNGDQALLAVGTESGHVSVYRITEDDLQLEKTFPKQEERVLCLTWHPGGNILVSGSVGVIKLWNVETGSCLETIEVSQDVNTSMETTVWCVGITSDMVVISGDSLGRTSFWDGNTGTLLSSFTSHKADVLCLCVNSKEDAVYSSGVDPVIIKFIRESSKKENKGRKWIAGRQLQVHTHDVQCMIETESWLVSGGVDTHLAFTNYQLRDTMKRFPFQQNSAVTIAQTLPCILFHHPQKLEVWHLGSTNVEVGKHGEKLPLATKPTKLLELKCKDEEHMISSAISKNATRLAYSTLKQVLIFDFTIDKNTLTSSLSVSLRKNCTINCCSHHLEFLSSSNRLLIAQSDGSLSLYEVAEKTARLLKTFQSYRGKSSNIQHMAVTSDDKFVVVADSKRNIISYNLQTWELHSVFPKYSGFVTALAIHPVTHDVVAVYNNQSIFEYSLLKQSYTKWCKRVSEHHVSFGFNEKFTITGIVFHPRYKEMLILYNESVLYCIDKKAMFSSEKAVKQHKTPPSLNKPKSLPENKGVTVCERYKNIVALKKFEDDLIVVEIPPDVLIGQLPAPLQKKRFGV